MIAVCQQYFFRDDQTPVAHHRWTYSVFNVTIESFWRRLRSLSAQYWLNEFEKLEYDGFYLGTNVDKWCIAAVYLPLIKADLNRAKSDHNEHNIRTQRNRIRPGGVPEDLFTVPELYGGRQCGRMVTQSDVDDAVQFSDVGGLELPDFLPGVVARMIHNWRVMNRVSVKRTNARNVYLQLRELLYDSL